ncbi:copper amine oxidase [Circinella umbellata]|nr:copper amine oxidase [Circinella umbellata]
MKTATAATISKRPYAHPLDQLTGDEVVQVSQIVRGVKAGMNFVFNTITLKEPPKSAMMSFLGWDTSKPRVTQIEREAFVIILEKESMNVYEAVVSLDSETIKSWKYVPDVQPILTMDEMFEVEELVLKDEGVQAECRELGIKDMSQVFSDPWAIARHVNYPGRSKRMMQALMYMRTCEDDNQYAHPLDFIPIIDLGKMKVVAIERIKPRNSKFTRPTIPQMNHNFLPEFIGEENFRKDIKPIVIQQPQGVSFTVKGNEVDWQKWNMRVSMNYREGLVIHNVSYQDGDEKRPLFYRIAMSEMVVPYADPNTPHHRKHAFDVGEYGMGLCTNSLTLGCDCLGSIYYFDACFNDHEGKPFHVPSAICMHEEDAGILFKHTDYRNGRAHTVRSRRLVISQIVTVANYDYGLYYYFYQDGTFEYEVKATGELNTHVLAEDETPGDYGVIVAPQINAQYHQHFFTMRIDPMIDGPNNSVVQYDSYTSPFPTGHERNKYGNAFLAKPTILKDTFEAQATANFETSRFWKIINENRVHPYTKEPVGWKIMSNNMSPFYPSEESIVAQRAPFAKKGLWVTPYNEDQMFAGGFYCNQSDGSDNLEAWANRERQNVQNTDIVVWLTFAVTHLPRVEDFPVMPVEHVSMMMKPANFFMANPGLDIAPSNKSTNKSVYADANVAPTSSCCSSSNGNKL